MNKTCFLAVVLAGLVVAVAHGQIFPEEEYIDVLYIMDGSTIRGRIIESDTPDRVRVEIFGGSVFAVAERNIERIEQVPNPDYGREPLHIDLEERAATGAATRAAEKAPPLRPRWIFPVSLGIEFSDADPYITAGAAHRLGDKWYGGVDTITFFNNPIPFPLLLVGYGQVPAERLYLAGLLLLPAGTATDETVGAVQFGIAFNRFSINAMFTTFSPGKAGLGRDGGLSIGYVF